jgi:hypothetical protein
MLGEVLAALAATGGTALVGAMATDAWASARNGVARLFRHAGADRQAAIEAQLDGNVVLVERATDPGQARAALSGLWQMELARLLDEHPDAESELRTLITEIHKDLPAGQKLWVQNNIARDHGQIFAAMDGNVIVHQAPSTPSADPAPSTGTGGHL